MKKLSLFLIGLFLTTNLYAACDSQTVLLLHSEGTNGSTTFIDSSTSAKAMTAGGNAHIDTSTFKFGSASGAYDGTGDFVSALDSNDWNFGTGNFTEEGWFNFSSTAGNQRLIQQTQDANNNSALVKFVDDNTLKFIVTSAGSQLINLSGAFTPSTATWYHIALIRGWNGNANDWAITVNGTAVATTTLSFTMPDFAGPMYVGSGQDGTRELTGNADEVRISKGIARWTANFTPATSAYCADSPATFLEMFD